jgi:predicted DNA-binding transcriptional regulator YafY
MNDGIVKNQSPNSRVYLSALRRLHKIDRELAHDTYPNAEQLATLLGVRTRTVKRDIAFMRDNFNAPISYSRQRGGYHYTVQGWCLPLTRLSEGELLAFFIAENALRLTGHTQPILL